MSSYSTVEAQSDLPAKARSLRRFRDLFFSSAKIDDPDDLVEQELKSVISESSGGSEHDFLKHLLKDYRKFKNGPSSAVSNNMLQCWTFQESVGDDVINSQVDVLPADCKATFAAFITTLSQHLLTTYPNRLRVLAMSFEAEIEISQIFPKLIRQKSLPLTLRNTIAFLVAQRLKIPRISLVFLKNPSIHDKRRELLQPPSRKSPHGNLDPTQVEDDHIELTWQMKAPTFVGDTDIYVWEPYKALPIIRYVDIRLYPQSPTEEIKLIILFRHSGSLRSFVDIRGDASVYRPTLATDVQVWSPNSEVFFSICAAFQVMILEMTKFLQGCSLELEKMNLKGRQNPSVSKVQYLVHFEDCRESAHEGVVHGLQVLDSVSKWIDTQQMSQPLWYAGESFQNRLATLQCDLDFFLDQFTKVGKEVKELKQTLQVHLDLKYDRRNFVLTIFAVVYLPLSFAATLFGMNLETKTPAGPESFSNWTTSWIDSSPANMQNSTKALVSTIDRSGPRTYNWQDFVLLATGLLFTLPIYLTVGRIVRLIFRTSIYGKKTSLVVNSLLIIFIPFGVYGFMRVSALICAKSLEEFLRLIKRKM